MVSSEPRCPRCQNRPRYRYPGGILSPYCQECSREAVRNRSGYSKAERRCEGCGTMYKGNSRARVQRCPACRTTCATCEQPKKADGHSECQRCRNAAAAGELCATCGLRPRHNGKRTCWPCFNSESPQRDRKYKLEPDQYDTMVMAQHGLCAICQNPEKQKIKATGEPLPLSVDHDHTCCPGDRSCGHCIRDLICRNCNAGLGMFDDDPVLLRAAADYIERHRT